jgi:hypothetical protein
MRVEDYIPEMIRTRQNWAEVFSLIWSNLVYSEPKHTERRRYTDIRIPEIEEVKVAGMSVPSLSGNVSPTDGA